MRSSTGMEVGVEQIVKGRGEHVIEVHFYQAYELEALLSVREKIKEVDGLLESIPITGFSDLRIATEAAGA